MSEYLIIVALVGLLSLPLMMYLGKTVRFQTSNAARELAGEPAQPIKNLGDPPPGRVNLGGTTAPNGGLGWSNGGGPENPTGGSDGGTGGTPGGSPGNGGGGNPPGGTGGAGQPPVALDCRADVMSAANKQLTTMPPGTRRQQLAEAESRYARDSLALQHARLSANTYQASDGVNPDRISSPPDGWIDISHDAAALAKYGLRPEDLRIPDSHFNAEMYAPDPASSCYDPSVQPVLAFRGTNPKVWEDWKNNIEQGINWHSDYYQRAVHLGEKLLGVHADVYITGHSLGGGLASAASRASGLPADTFNAAGLNKKTVTHYGGSTHGSSINAYRVMGELLTELQENGWGSVMKAAGAGALLGGLKGALLGAALKAGLGAIMPDPVGQVIAMPGSGSALHRHNIQTVINDLVRRTATDQQAVEDALNAPRDDPSPGGPSHATP